MVAAVTVIIMCIALSACSASIEGTYKFSSMSYSSEGVQLDVKAGEQFMGLITFTEDAFVLEINSDGTISFTTSMMGEESVEAGTWEKKDGKYYLTIGGEEQEVTLKGKKLTMSSEFEGMSAEIVLVKQ